MLPYQKEDTKCSASIHDELKEVSNRLLPIYRELQQELDLEFKDVNFEVKYLSSQITQMNRISETAQNLLTILGVGPPSATMLGIELGDGICFKNGQRFSTLSRTCAERMQP